MSDSLDPEFTIQLRKLIYNGNTVTLEEVPEEAYMERLLQADLITKDRNSVGRCWFRGYYGKEIE